MKIFLDANIFVAACGNSEGGSSYLFQVAEFESSWHLLTSALALREARVNIRKKLPEKIENFEAIILSPRLTIVESSPAFLTQELQRIIVPKDVPILAAAIFAKAGVLCTLDQKDFHIKKVKTWCRQRGLLITTPGDLLIHWREKHQ